jgi:exopolyphosphatase/guanosine-5'-triphosphate,3'-diphosphate pyrophosphatase
MILMNFPFTMMAIDTGSNSIKTRTWRINPDYSPVLLDQDRYPLSLGADVFRHGCISTISLEELKRIYEIIASESGKHDVDHTRAVATSALREADNGPEVVEEIYCISGIRIGVLDGHEEADLIFQGLPLNIRMKFPNLVIIDIGGGSTEIIRVMDPGTMVTCSLPLGAVRLTELFLRNSKPEDDDYQEARMFIQKEISSHLIEKSASKNLAAFGTGGTIHALARLIHGIEYTPGNSGDAEWSLKFDELQALTKSLRNLSSIQIENNYGIDRQRAQIIRGGLLVLNQLMPLLDLTEIIPFEGGVSDGLLQECISNLKEDASRQDHLNDHAGSGPA